MKLLCGHVISRDALNKLGQGVNKYEKCFLTTKILTIFLLDVKLLFKPKTDSDIICTHN